MRYAILLAMLPGCYIYNDPDTYSSVSEFRCSGEEIAIQERSYCHAVSTLEPESTPDDATVYLYVRGGRTPETLHVGRGGVEASDYVRCEGGGEAGARWVKMYCFGFEGVGDE